MFKKQFFMFDESTAGSNPPAPKGASPPSGGNEGGETLTFEQWFEKQDEAIKALLDGHTKGLKSALKTERETRTDQEKQLRELAAKAEKGSEAQKQLTELADKLAEADKKTDFFDAAHKAGVTNLKLAFTVATQEDLFDKKGQVNFEQLKKDYPELFATKKAPQGGAGSGTGEDQPKGGDMNAFIRRAAGRGS